MLSRLTPKALEIFIRLQKNSFLVPTLLRLIKTLLCISSFDFYKRLYFYDISSALLISKT